MSKELVDKIKEEFKSQTGKSNGSIGLPTDYNYCISEDTLHLTIKNPNENMQKDAGAFDAWTLVIKRWVTRIDKIILSWEKSEQIENSDYQRFLYRVKKSIDIYDWLVVDNNCIHLLDDLLIKESFKYVVSFPSLEAKLKPKDIESRMEEMFSNEYSCKLSKVAGMDQDKIYRQLPVGVFKDSKALANTIFAGGSATVDLWGLNESKKELHIFELKAKYDGKEKYNKPMGIYSQLFFYAMIQEDLINEVLKVDNLKNIDFRGFKYLTDYGYKNIKSINAHFLVNEIHPLIDAKMIDLINNSFRLKSKDIKFDIIKYKLDDSKELIELYKV